MGMCWLAYEHSKNPVFISHAKEHLVSDENVAGASWQILPVFTGRRYEGSGSFHEHKKRSCRFHPYIKEWKRQLFMYLIKSKMLFLIK